MPLPPFEKFRTVWVEKTKSSHGHGGAGWEFGICLWSPTTDKSGKKIYQNMTAARDGDLVLHFYEDTPFGKETDHYFCGLSIVDGSVEIRKDEPPLAGEWAYRSEYYRVNLRDFIPFVDGLPIRQFVRKHHEGIIAAIVESEDQPFILYQNAPRLAQGKYLSHCCRTLCELLSNEIPDEVAVSGTSQNGDQRKSLADRRNAEPFDYEEYVEGQRAKREISFFARNPRLVRDAKDRYGTKCMACTFQYVQLYPEIGHGYIEVHHLDPLSERGSTKANQRLTKLDQVAVLCANCHRMIHRLIRKQGRAVSIDEFQNWIRES